MTIWALDGACSQLPEEVGDVIFVIQKEDSLSWGVGDISRGTRSY
jgi:hypothetical protein